MFEQALKNIDDVLRKEAGCTTELDYTEQTSWLLFLKYLDGLDQDRAIEAGLDGRKYAFILDEAYRWESWAAPKGRDGKLDHNNAMIGDDLRDFVDRQLFPYLHGFTQKASGPNTIEYKIGQIFGEIRNKISSGYNLREVIDHIDELRFRSQSEKHELSALYEEKIKRMGNAGRNGGEYYTPRPLIRAIIEVVKPSIGERIYDPACGSAGFLCESFDYLRSGGNLTTRDLTTLQTRTFYGKEKKSLAYVIAIMNMILHGIEAPNVIHTNSLSESLADIEEKDRFEVVLANPPFGGKERREVQQNFPIRTGETAFLFLQHLIRRLKAGGRGGVVIKNTFLSNTDNASVSLRKLLLESCNLQTVLDLPGGAFQGAGAGEHQGAAVTNGWQTKKVSEIADHSLGKMLDKAKNKGEPKPYLRNLNVRWFDFDLCDLLEMRFLPEEASKYTVANGDVVICEGGYPGRAAIWDQDEPIYFQKALHRVRFHEPEHNKWFLYYLLSRDLDGTLKRHFNGAGIQHFTGETLARFEIPLPPLSEQRRIVGILDEAFAGIATAKANTEKNLQNARALFESHLNTVFSQHGEGWAKRRLGEVAESISTGPFGTMLHKSDYVVDGIPLVNPMNIVEHRIVSSDRMMVSKQTRDRLRAYVLKVGDVVIGRRGELGRCALVTEHEDGWLCGTGSFVVRLSDRIDGKFFVALFGSRQFRARLEEGAVGATMSSLNHGILNDLLLPIPPLAVQRAAIAKAEELSSETRRLGSLYQRKLVALDKLKKSLLHQAFTGQL